MTRVIITDYVSDGHETYTLRVDGLDEPVRLILPPDAEEGRTRIWIGETYWTRHPLAAKINDAWVDIRVAIAEFGDTLLREYEARDIHKIIREAELAAVRALAALHNDDDKEN